MNQANLVLLHSELLLLRVQAFFASFDALVMATCLVEFLMSSVAIIALTCRVTATLTLLVDGLGETVAASVYVISFLNVQRHAGSTSGLSIPKSRIKTIFTWPVITQIHR